MNRLLRLRQVMDQTGLGSSTIYRHIAAGTFPAPLKIGGHSARWLQASVDAWVENLIHKQNGSGVHAGVSQATLAGKAQQDQQVKP